MAPLPPIVTGKHHNTYQHRARHTTTSTTRTTYTLPLQPHTTVNGPEQNKLTGKEDMRADELLPLLKTPHILDSVRGSLREQFWCSFHGGLSVRGRSRTFHSPDLRSTDSHVKRKLPLLAKIIFSSVRTHSKSPPPSTNSPPI